MIRLYNNTRHPDAVLRRALTYAARRIGPRSDLVVKVTTGRVSGTAHGGWPYRGYLRGWRRGGGPSQKRLVGGAAGWFEIRLPAARSLAPRAALAVAEQFIDAAMHEAAHVADHRDGLMPGLRAAERTIMLPSGRRRRIAHDQRPVEISAENWVWDARPRTKAQCLREAEIVELVAESLVRLV